MFLINILINYYFKIRETIRMIVVSETTVMRIFRVLLIIFIGFFSFFMLQRYILFLLKPNT